MKTCRRNLHQFSGSQCKECKKIWKKLNSNKEWKKLNPDKRKIINKISSSLWRKKNTDKCNFSSSKRRANKINAGLNLTENQSNLINLLYQKASKLTLETGIRHHVHHIIPLKEFSHIFSGLHVPWNLEILTEEEHIEAHRKLREKYKQPQPIR